MRGSRCSGSVVHSGHALLDERRTALNVQLPERLWGSAKVRYRGLAKNTVRMLALGMLANLFRVRHRLMPQGTSCRRERRNRPNRATPPRNRALRAVPTGGRSMRPSSR